MDQRCEFAIREGKGGRYGFLTIVRVWQHALASRVTAKLQTGVVWVNTHHRNDPASPWGSLQTKENASGIGKENGLSALEAYSQLKSVSYNLASEESRRQTEDWFQMGDSRYG